MSAWNPHACRRFGCTTSTPAPQTDPSSYSCTGSRHGRTCTAVSLACLQIRACGVIAPDNVGFGRSDKLTEATAYTFRRHVDWAHSLVAGLDLREVTLVVQDWGGPIGLSVLARDPPGSRGWSRPTRSCTPATRRWQAGSRGRTTASTATG